MARLGTVLDREVPAGIWAPRIQLYAPDAPAILCPYTYTRKHVCAGSYRSRAVRETPACVRDLYPRSPDPCWHLAVEDSP